MPNAAKKRKKAPPPIKLTLDEIPESLLDYLRTHNDKNVLFGVRTDLTPDGGYCDQWVLVFDEYLLVTQGEKGSGVKPEWEPVTYGRYYYKEIKELKIDNYVATGSLVGVFVVHGKEGKKGGTCEKPIALFTNSCMQKMVRLMQLAEKLRKKEPFTPGDLDAGQEATRCPECGRLYPDRDRPICPKCLKRTSLFMRVLSYSFRYKFDLAVVTVLMLLMSVVGIITPYVNGVVLYDQALREGGKYYGHVIEVVLVMLGLTVLRTVFWIMQGRLGGRLSAQIVYDIKLEIFSAMQRLSMRFYNGKSTGGLMTRINSDAIHIQYFLNDGVPYLLVNVLTMVVMTVIMLTMSVPLTLLIFTPVPFIIVIIKVLIPRFRRYKWRMFTKTSRLNAMMSDSFTAVRVVKAFGREQTEEERFDTVNNALFEANLRTGRQGAMTFPLLSWVMSIGTLFIAGFGGWRTMNGVMTFGTLMTFINFMGYLYGPINQLFNGFDWWTDCMNAAQRMFEVIDRKPDIVENKKPVILDPIKGAVSLQNITFSYEPNKPVLHKINLTIREGEMIGLVGHSGAGKSTITNLVTRLYDVDEGEIKIDGVNIKDIRLSDLRRQIGMVLQDTFLFTGTVAQNIAFAKPEASRDEIIRAAKIANAHEFIVRLPDGYDTLLGGRRQMRLSGGEQQRISIARAVLIDPRILILDEATASVDTETEKQIQEALEALVKGRTTIAIAHRLSTLRNANRLVVVEQGRIVEIGTHQELEAKKGVYYKMLNIQREALKIRGVE